MNPKDRKRIIQEKVRRTMEKVAARDNTASMMKLKVVIMEEFRISLKTAENYIKELVSIGMLNCSGDMLWHTKSQEIRNRELMRFL